MEQPRAERSHVIPAVLLVAVAFGLLFFSVRSVKIADAGADGLRLLPPAQVQTAPDWALPDASTGQIVRLSEQAKRGPVVFSFWATWCGPCRAELPHLEQLSHKYAGRVQFYGVNSDDPAPVMPSFASRLGLTFPMLSDAKRDAETQYGVEAIPMLVVVDSRGKVRAVSVGYREDMEEALSKILDTLLVRS